MRAEAQKVVDDADAAAARILSTAQARANKQLADAQAKLDTLQERGRKLAEAIRGVSAHSHHRSKASLFSFMVRPVLVLRD
jgi:hypothetical protein